MKKLFFLVSSTFILAATLPSLSYADDYGCRYDFGPHAIDAGIPWKCRCKEWYMWNYEKTQCIVENFQNLKQICQQQYGNLATYSETNIECSCSSWSTRNKDQTQCIELTNDLALQICKKEFWSYATTGDSLENCNCQSWYTFNENKTQCVQDTKDQAKIRCENRYWIGATVGKTLDTCDCKPGYTWNKYQTICINEFLIKKDIPLSEEIKQAINWMYDNKLTIFNTVESFMGENFLTREQAAKFFVQSVKSVWKRDEEKIIQIALSDINKADPTLQSYIREAVQMGLFQWVKGNFNPFNKLTKAQALAVLIRAIDGIKPENISPWYLNYYLLADKYNLLNGLNFSLDALDKQNITRKEIALLLYRVEKREGKEICKRDFWEHALREGKKDDWSYICGCEYGYLMVNENNECILEEIVQEGSNQCKKYFGEASYSDGTKADNWEYNCRCETGYNRDDEKNPTRCI